MQEKRIKIDFSLPKKKKKKFKRGQKSMKEHLLSNESKNRMLYITNIFLRNKSKTGISNRQSQENLSQ